MSKRLIGYCGVDSGQIMITDPCYIDSEWTERGMEDVRKYADKDGKVYQFRVHFENYEDKVKDGKSVNELLASKELTQIESPVDNDFSYGGCCSVTLGKAGIGELRYRMGHTGVAVVAGNFGGDGTYPVYAEVEDGLVQSITIEFA